MFTSSLAVAQEVTPIWVQHINGTVNVDTANKLPILVKPTDVVVAQSPYRDGREPLANFARLIPYSLTRLLLAVAENGINEDDATITQAQKDLAAQYPDRSLIWLEASTGKPLGIAWKESLRPGEQINYDVTAAHKGYQSSAVYALWRPAMDQNPDPTQRAIYSGYKHLLLRYAPKADGTGWETTPTIAWQEPVPGLADDGSIAPEAGIGDGLSGTTSESGDQGSWRAWRWRNFRVAGYGTNTQIYAGGGTWRVGMHPQVFATTNGLNFTPIARVNDRDQARRNGYSLGGCSSEVITYGGDPARPNLQVVYHGHYPGTGWDARPNRYTSNPGKPTASPDYNQQPNVRLFSLDEAKSPGLPKFVWEAAGKDGLPIDHEVDGVTRYDGNWNQSISGDSSLDYLVAISSASLDVSWNTYGWLGIHRLDGSIADGNSSYKLAYREDDVQIDYSNIGGGTEADFDTTESWVDVVPDPTTAANLKAAYVCAAFENGGFGLFHVQNVAAQIVRNPTDVTAVAGTDVTISAEVTGSPNNFQWYKDGKPVVDTTYIHGAHKVSLTLRSVTPADAGSYILTLNNPLSGKAQTTAAKLTVTGLSVRWEGTSDIMPQDVALVEGEVITNSATAFTLKGGGLKAFTGTADSLFFRYESVTGDFDKKVRITNITADSADETMARGGLMVRENTSASGRELELLAANPAGANLIRVAGRGYTDQGYTTGGGILSRDLLGVSTNLPNQWLRIRRVGDVFEFFVGTNGTAWTLLSQRYLALSSTVNFGPFASADNDSGSTQVTVDYADYGDYQASDTTAPTLLSAGTLDKKTIGLKFSEALNSVTATAVGNYTVSGATVYDARIGISPNTVYLSVSGLTSDTFTVTVAGGLGGVSDAAGNSLAGTATVSGKVSNWKVSDIGYIQDPNNRPTIKDDPYTVGAAVAISSDDNPELEIVGGGSNSWNAGDFITYVYREITGDFDVVAAYKRYDRTFHTGGYGNSGIHVRNSLYVDGAATTWPKTPADTKVINYVNVTYQERSGPDRSAIEIRRETDGGDYGNSDPVNVTTEIGGRLGYFGELRAADASGAILDKVPADNARWLRVKRTGSHMESFVSYEGTNWQSNSSVDMTGLKTTVLVGIAVQSDAGSGAPPDANVYAENGTVDDNDVATLNDSNVSVLRVSNLGDLATAFPTTKAQLNYTWNGSSLVLTWSDATYKLQSTSALGGTWQNETGASPVTVTPVANAYKFYRLAK
jgi:hypothetical protein